MDSFSILCPKCRNRHNFVYIGADQWLCPDKDCGHVVTVTHLQGLKPEQTASSADLTHGASAPGESAPAHNQAAAHQQPSPDNFKSER